jgi:hypothetical protein
MLQSYDDSFRPFHGERKPSVACQTFKKRILLRRAPASVQCELCQRHGARTAGNFTPAAIKGSDRLTVVGPETARALCVDCSDLLEGTIDVAEWKRRTNFRAANSVGSFR